MGIQIYIKKEALEHLGILISYDEETQHYPCRCGEVELGYCNVCQSSAKKYVNRYVHLQGLDLAMYDFGDAVYHDANHWGSSRKPIIDFIDKHRLKAGEDWHEC